MHPVLGLVEDLRKRGAKDFITDFHLLQPEFGLNLGADACFSIVECRQTVQEDNIGVARSLHHLSCRPGRVPKA